MTSFFGGFFSGVNNATDMLSGAIDIVVIRQPNGTFKCTPFHVRFGRLKLLRSKEKIIRIMVNGKLTDLCMKIGEVGEAYFVQETDEPIPYELSTSPIPSTSPPRSPTGKEPSSSDVSPLSSPPKSPVADIVKAASEEIPPPVIAASQVFGGADYHHNESKDMEPYLFRPISPPTVSAGSFSNISNQIPPPAPPLTLLPSSSSSSSSSSPQSSLPSRGAPDSSIETIGLSSLNTGGKTKKLKKKHKKATTYTSPNLITPGFNIPPTNQQEQNQPEQGQAQVVQNNSWSWMWGQLPVRFSSWFGFNGKENADGKQFQDEFYDLDVKHDFIEQQFYETLAKQYHYNAAENTYIGNNSSDLKLKTPPKNSISVATADKSSLHEKKSKPRSSEEEEGGMPRVDSLSIIDENFSDDISEEYTEDSEADSEFDEIENEMNNGRSQLNSNPIAISFEKKRNSLETVQPMLSSSFNSSQLSSGKSPSNTLYGSPMTRYGSMGETSFRAVSSLETNNGLISKENKDELKMNAPVTTPAMQKSSWTSWLGFGIDSNQTIADSSKTQPTGPTHPHIAKETKTEKILMKSLRPTSEQLASLHLVDGKNEIKFIVTSRFQGTQEVTANVYLWPHNCKIVISDVDGTITRSDALGHILPMFGKDWSHAGIVQLYTNIKKNGYKILYLTSRSIVQAGSTREYILNLKQDGATLPDGPVIMAPDRLFQCLAREVITKRPEEFKIAALRDINNLFPVDYNPFFAGFGNKPNDFISYRTVGVPTHKIFIVNPESQLVCYGVSHQSYKDVSELSSHIFPPINSTPLDIPKDFRSWNYWKLTPQYNLDEL